MKAIKWKHKSAVYDLYQYTVVLGNEAILYHMMSCNVVLKKLMTTGVIKIGSYM